ncbi:mucin-5AC [Anopheles darlingi]|uniref:mucin-5AC n=1 Tax=Anopheles darlingi TaxID=43151 RepID=UPI0021000B96|nr:mucin-5AC [Anopheles darlingi]XP_049531973.1 mucin-5AC [Anopheles darlingi]XP_049531974.1 mucin-5AC [Anopheles darlingi]XP_049531975.1 mucin-5AC [Anopheles darlingi]XP_049531976.1 mucin-5AC [Anopheles darlingi]
MNIDPTKAPEKEQNQQQQQQQQQQQEQEHEQRQQPSTGNSDGALALLISPSSPSSASTVSPTVSSISKNSSTDEIDENTADVEQQPQQPQSPNPVIEQHVTASEEPSQTETEKQPVCNDNGKQHRGSGMCYEQSYQRLSQVEEQETIAHETARPEETEKTQESIEMDPDCLPTPTDTLLAQCIPDSNVTTETEIERRDRYDEVGKEEPTVANVTNLVCVRKNVMDGGKNTTESHTTEQEFTTEALKPRQLSSSSSSTASTPSVAETTVGAVASSDVMAGERCCEASCLAASNNNLPLLTEPDFTLTPNVATSIVCINNNDCYNNNKSSSIDAGESTMESKADDEFVTSATCTSNNIDIADAGECVMLANDGERRVIPVATTATLTEGDPVSATSTAPDSSTCEPSGTQTTATCTSESKPYQAMSMVVAPIEIVQSTQTATNTINSSTTAEDEGVELSETKAEALVATGTDTAMLTTANITTTNASDVDSLLSFSLSSLSTPAPHSLPPSSSSTAVVATVATLPPTSGLSFDLSSPTTTPNVLAKSQQEIKLTSASAIMQTHSTLDENLAIRRLHEPHERPSLESEGLLLVSSNAGTQPTVAVAAVCSSLTPDKATSVDEQATHNGNRPDASSHILTLAEELSAAAAVVAAAQAVPSASAATSLPLATASAVVTLPKSAAGTASSSSSPLILHSSLKKPNKLGVMTGTRAANDAVRRVSFPRDAELITGYLAPVNPWACISICKTPELVELYRSSCKRHSTLPLKSVLEHLQSVDMTKGRVPLLSLRDQNLSYGSCEALEEIFKHVQYRCIDLSHSGLDDVTASVMFDIIEYYEAANELDISDNLQMSSKSWTACINMLKKSQALNVLITRGPTISDYQATNLAKALNTSAIHTLKLEHCVLSQQPIASLCSMLKRNTVLRELWLAHNQLICEDAQQIANLLRSNFYIQLIDISNNRIGDKGVEYIVNAIVEQSVYFKDVQDKKRKADLNFTDLSSSLNSINSSKNYFPQRLRTSDSLMSIASDNSDTSGTSPAGTPLTPPVTPPSTPALPSIESSSSSSSMQQIQRNNVAENANEAAIATVKTASTVYTTLTQSNDENHPPPSPQPPSPSPLTGVAPPNVNLVETSTKLNNSISQQNSDRERFGAGLVVTAEEAALIRAASGTKTTSECDSLMITSPAATVQSERVESMGEAQTVELVLSFDQSESPVPQSPKKARLAKQDSVLSEFEAALIDPTDAKPKQEEVQKEEREQQHGGGRRDRTSSDVSDPTGSEQQPHQLAARSASTSAMDEDVSELCADYDDDGSNLKISQENLFVDLAITNDPENKLSEKSVLVPEVGQFTAVVLPAAPLKKDELQLLIEKSQHQEPPLEAAIEAREEGDHSHTKEEGRKASNAKAEDTLQQVAALDEEQTNNSAIGGGATMESLKRNRSVEIEIKGGGTKTVPLSRSLDSVGDESDFEMNSSPFIMAASPSSNFPNERSFSSESLNSETSIDSNDSKSSLKIIESKFAAKNGTLERQQSNINRDIGGTDSIASTAPTGLQVLVLWNNEITRKSASNFAKLIEKTSTLDTLNVGSNLLCNSFVTGIGQSLKTNASLTNLGLQGAHLSDKGAKAMAEVIEFGGNASLQRIDLRNNNIQKAGLEALNEAMKSNKSVTRIDLDDTPRRVKDSTLDGVGSEYSRLVNNIRAQCERNKNPPEPSESANSSTQVRRARANYLSSRKISLTCQSIRTSPSALADKQHLLEPSGGTSGPGGCKKPSGRLRSPLPSPIPSPIASPVPSPSRNRFLVSRVTDSTGSGSGGSSGLLGAASTSPSPSSTGSSPTLFFPSNSRFRVVTVAEPDPVAKGANTRSGSTISLPSKSSFTSSPPPASSSAAIGMPPSGLIGTSGRRPVCSSAPTFSSFSSSSSPSPSSPLAAASVTVAGVPSVRLNSPSPLLPPLSNPLNNTNILPPTLLPMPTAAVSAAMPMMGTFVAAPTIPQIIPQNIPLLQQQHPQFTPSPLLYQPQMPLQLQQQQHQQQPIQCVQQQGYPLITTFVASGNAMIPMAPLQQQSTVIPTVPQNTAPHMTPSSQRLLQQMQPTILPQTQPPSLVATTQYTTPSAPCYHPPKGRHLSTSHNSNSSSSTTLHDSVLSSTSIESPDLEVKRFMSGGIMDDSCCSSISSIDSIDNPNFNNTSISSADESFDLLTGASCSPKPLVTGSSDHRSRSTSTTSSSNSVATRPAEESTLVARSSTGPDAVRVSPLQPHSSTMVVVGTGVPLLQSASSQESLYDVHDLSASSNSSSLSATNWTVGTKPPLPTVAGASVVGNTAPVPASNSNESTLTATQHFEKEPKSSGGSSPAEKVAASAPRVRKTSWIHSHIGGGGSSASKQGTDSSSSGGSTPTPSGGSGYPPAIEKLLSIFNPSNLFSSNKSSSASPPNVVEGAGIGTGPGSGSGGSHPPSRKESPMGGLFYWAHGGSSNAGSNNNTITSPSAAPIAPASAKKDEDRVLRVNVSPETTLTPQQLQPLQNQAQIHHHQHQQAERSPGVAAHQQQSVENLPPQLKVEMKENISPENTITNKLLTTGVGVVTSGGGTSGSLPAEPSVVVVATPSSNPVPCVSMVTAPHSKVIFQLGGDYDESEDDIETLTSKFGNASMGHYYGSHQSGASSLIGSTASNSSGISIGSATSAGEAISGAAAGSVTGGMGRSLSPNTTAERLSSEPTTMVLSHLGQLARDSLSMFKNPSLTSQDSMSIRSMDSLPEMTIEAAANYNPLTAVMTAPTHAATQDGLTAATTTKATTVVTTTLKQRPTAPEQPPCVATESIATKLPTISSATPSPATSSISPTRSILSSPKSPPPPAPPAASSSSSSSVDKMGSQ